MTVKCNEEQRGPVITGMMQERELAHEGRRVSKGKPEGRKQGRGRGQWGGQGGQQREVGRGGGGGGGGELIECFWQQVTGENSFDYFEFAAGFAAGFATKFATKFAHPAD